MGRKACGVALGVAEAGFVVPEDLASVGTTGLDAGSWIRCQMVCSRVSRRGRSGSEFEGLEADASFAGSAVGGEFVVAGARLVLEALEEVVEHVAEHP